LSRYERKITNSRPDSWIFLILEGEGIIAYTGFSIEIFPAGSAGSMRQKGT
jgi:hypothetical protein